MPSSGSAKLQIAGEIRAWMVSIIQASGMSARDWAIKAGVAASTVQRAIKDDYPFVTSSQTLAKLAAVASVEPPSLGKRSLPSIVRLPVRNHVRAGAWFEYQPHAQDDFLMENAAPDPDFPIDQQWLEEVHGDSMNLLIPDDCLVLVTEAFGREFMDGDIVVVERRRNDGQLRERSIKQVAKHPDGRIELWPRSTNTAKYNAPIAYNDTADETVEVEIVGLVLSYTKKLRRR